MFKRHFCTTTSQDFESQRVNQKFHVKGKVGCLFVKVQTIEAGSLVHVWFLVTSSNHQLANHQPQQQLPKTHQQTTSPPFESLSRFPPFVSLPSYIHSRCCCTPGRSARSYGHVRWKRGPLHTLGPVGGMAHAPVDGKPWPMWSQKRYNKTFRSFIKLFQDRHFGVV